MDKDKILNRIRNCMALANGNNSEGESINAMRMARKLMALHQINMSEVEQVDPNNMGKIVLPVGNRIWKRWLAGSLIQFLGLYGVYSKHEKSLIVFGDKSILEPFEWCWGMATGEIDRAVLSVNRQRKDNYRKQMVLGIRSELATVQATEVESITALVVQAGDRAKEFALSQITVCQTKSRKTTVYRDTQAYSQGQEVGSRLRNQDKVLGEE
jgi:hypothetical protein